MLPKDSLNMFKKTVVFLGNIYEHGEVVPNATGFLVEIKGLLHLVTAKHVIYDYITNNLTDAETYAFVNTTANSIRAVRISEMKRMLNCDWIFHQNNNIDVAIIPFNSAAADDLAHVPQNIFLSFEEIFELQDIFFISYQPGIQIRIQNRISPIIRTGSVSVMNDNSTFYIDAASFPGNSGSPVFTRPSTMYGQTNTQPMGGGYLIGVIGSYLFYEDVAISLQTGQERVKFQENTGLSKVWSTFFINQTIESTAFTFQIDRILKMLK
jgi:predicted DNA-binding ArsR family transcriptional regulator